MRKLIHIVVFVLICTFLKAQGTTLFSLRFNDPVLTPEASGSTTVKTFTTTYGIVKYLNLSIYSLDSKKYREIEIDGWIDFKSGSQTISSTSSYIELPPITFTNGGIVSINYGVGSTGRELRLQEWTGSAWSNGAYEEITADSSSTWYRHNWEVVGSGTKVFRIVLSSSPPMYITHIDVYGNVSAIETDVTDTLDFGQVNYIGGSAVRAVNVTGSYLTNNITVSPGAPYRVSTVENGAYYSTLSLPPTGGTVYVKYLPTAITENISTLTLSSNGAVSKQLILRGEGIYMSSSKEITSFSLFGIPGIIDEENKVINVIGSTGLDLSVPYTPEVELSPAASLVTTGAQFFEEGIPKTYTVRAEDGTTVDYYVLVDLLSSEHEIIAFELSDVSANIDNVSKTITITLPSSCDLAIAQTPIISVSPNAIIVNNGAHYFEEGVPFQYTVRAEDGTTANYTLLIDVLSAEKQIVSFSLMGQAGVINEASKTILVTVPATTNLALSYTPTLMLSANAILLTIGAQYFTEGVPVSYNVQAEDGSTASYQVYVDKLSNAKQILSFAINGKNGDIDDGDDEVDDDQTISLTLPSNTNLSSPITPEITVSPYASIITSLPVYFTSGVPLIFTVQAEDGSMLNYEVTVNIATDLGDAAADKPLVYGANNRMYIQASKSYAYTVYTVVGTLVEKGICSTGKYESPTLYMPGFYLVVINNFTYKVSVK